MVRVKETALERTRAAHAYRQRLQQGLNMVLNWLVVRDLTAIRMLETDSCDLLQLDQWLCEFVNEGWTADWKFLACQTLYQSFAHEIPAHPRKTPSYLGLSGLLGGSE